jgi:hypothetical protein
MAYAEGNANEFEVNIIWRTADLLGYLRDGVLSSPRKCRLTTPSSPAKAVRGRVLFGNIPDSFQNINCPASIV